MAVDSRGWMPVLALSVVAVGVGLMLASDDASATHYRGGSLHVDTMMVVGVSGLDSATVEAHGELAFDLSFPGLAEAAPGSCLQGHGSLLWGDGEASAFGMRVTTNDPGRNLLVARIMDLSCSTGLFHTYTSPGPFEVQVSGCCRDSAEVNNANHMWMLRARGDFDAANRAPQATAWMESMAQTLQCTQRQECKILIPTIDGNGDPMTARAAGPCDVDNACAYRPPGPPWAGKSPVVSPDATAGTDISWSVGDAQVGNYSYVVIVSDGKVDTFLDFAIEVLAAPNAAPAADFTWDHPVYAGEPVTFRDNSTDSDGTIVSWNWFFHTGDPVESTDQDPTTTFATPGNKYVRLFVKDDGGRSGFKYYYVSVLPNPPPDADFDASGHGTTWAFTDASSDNGHVASWHWDLGDGTNSTEQSPTHRYAPGTYTVTLTVTDDDGAMSSVSKTIQAPCKDTCTA